jgi:uncharacterized membrane protein
MTVHDADVPDASPAPYRLAGAVREDWPLFVLFATAVAAAAWSYSSLPERVPIHWNVRGEVDGWGGRAFGSFGMLGLFFGTYLLLLLLPLVDPRRPSYARFRSTYRLLRWCTTLLMVGIWAVVLLAARGVPVRVDVVAPVGVSLLLIVIGNTMGRLRPNWFVGIRTPWSLANDEAWRLTHRVSGPVWVAAGLLGLLGPLVGGPSGAIMMIGPIVGAAAFSIVYSYFAYKRSLRGPAQAR